MCCFSGEIQSVTNTKIFARQDGHGRQFVIYAMSVQSKKDVAMVLPLPVRPGSGEGTLTFFNLEKYPTLFQNMDHGFPVPPSRYSSKSPVAPLAPGLEVKRVGSYDASFVPSIADFSRLSSRFRLPPGTWEKLPGYAGFGFAVFKLRRGSHDFHPMAFSFPSAIPDRLFFPTLHIHDGEVHQKADFDHTLYCQGKGLSHRLWEESPKLANQFMNPDLSLGMVLGNEHVYRRKMNGELANTDVVVKARSMV